MDWMVSDACFSLWRSEVIHRWTVACIPGSGSEIEVRLCLSHSYMCGKNSICVLWGGASSSVTSNILVRSWITMLRALSFCEHLYIPYIVCNAAKGQGCTQCNVHGCHLELQPHFGVGIVYVSV